MIQAEFFDIFGFIGFLILLITGISIRKKAKTQSLIIIVISIIGLIIDGYIILNNFILG